jgi:hypothetical protein
MGKSAGKFENAKSTIGGIGFKNRGNRDVHGHNAICAVAAFSTSVQLSLLQTLLEEFSEII